MASTWTTTGSSSCRCELSRPITQGKKAAEVIIITCHRGHCRLVPTTLRVQGEVEQISMMKPKAEDKNDTGLLEYLEDIIGTHCYVQPIEESAKR